MTDLIPTPTVPRRRTSCAAPTWSSSSPTSRKSREFYVDVLGLHRHRGGRRTPIYLRSLRGVHPPQPRAAQGPRRRASPRFAYRVRSPGGRRRAPRPTTSELGLPRRAPRGRLRRRASATRCAWRTRWASRTSSSTTSSTSSASPGATTSTPPARSSASTTSTRSPRTCPRGRDVPGGPRLPRHRGHPGRRRHHLRRVDAPQADRARHRPDRRRRPAACTTSRSPRTRSTTSSQICDKLGALRISDRIERGPGRHGVSNAFYLYLRDPDGHRIEIYTQDYYTGDPDNPVVTWDVHDNQRRDWWGNPVVPSWYTEASLVLDLDGNPQPVVAAHRHERDGGHHRRRRLLLHPQGRRRRRSPSWKQASFKLGRQL